jgi:hypothetical protein
MSEMVACRQNSEVAEFACCLPQFNAPTLSRSAQPSHPPPQSPPQVVEVANSLGERESSRVDSAAEGSAEPPQDPPHPQLFAPPPHALMV